MCTATTAPVILQWTIDRAVDLAIGQLELVARFAVIVSLIGLVTPLALSTTLMDVTVVPPVEDR